MCPDVLASVKHNIHTCKMPVYNYKYSVQRCTAEEISHKQNVGDMY